MPIESIPVDPRKAFNYVMEVDGLPIAYIRKTNIPELEFGKVEHAHGGQRNLTKTAGKEGVGDISLEKVMPEDGADLYFENWRQEVRTLGADDYKRDIDIFHLGPDDTRIDHWQCEGCWPMKVEYSDHDAMSEADPIIETVTICVDELTRVF